MTKPLIKTVTLEIFAATSAREAIDYAISLAQRTEMVGAIIRFEFNGRMVEVCRGSDTSEVLRLKFPELFRRE